VHCLPRYLIHFLQLNYVSCLFNSHAFVAKFFPNRIVDSGASKHVVQDQVGFVDFHLYPVGLQIMSVGNGTIEDVLRVGTYRLKLRGGNSLLLHDTLYTPGVRYSLVS